MSAEGRTACGPTRRGTRRQRRECHGAGRLACYAAVAGELSRWAARRKALGVKGATMKRATMKLYFGWIMLGIIIGTNFGFWGEWHAQHSISPNLAIGNPTIEILAAVAYGMIGFVVGLVVAIGISIYRYVRRRKQDQFTKANTSAT